MINPPASFFSAVVRGHRRPCVRRPHCPTRFHRHHCHRRRSLPPPRIMLPCHFTGELDPIRGQRKQSFVKSTLDCVTLHGGFVAVVEDGKRLREYPPARLDAPAPPKVCRKNHEQVVTINFFSSSTKTMLLYFSSSLNISRFVLYSHSFPPFHEIQTSRFLAATVTIVPHPLSPRS